MDQLQAAYIFIFFRSLVHRRVLQNKANTLDTDSYAWIEAEGHRERVRGIGAGIFAEG